MTRKKKVIVSLSSAFILFLSSCFFSFGTHFEYNVKGGQISISDSDNGPVFIYVKSKILNVKEIDCAKLFKPDGTVIITEKSNVEYQNNNLFVFKCIHCDNSSIDGCKKLTLKLYTKNELINEINLTKSWYFHFSKPNFALH